MKPAADPLVGECARLCTYLVGSEPDAYVTRKYVEAHERLHPRLGGAAGPDAMVALARRGAHAAGLVDAYTRVFRRESLFRRKLILLVAILECAPSTAARFEAAAPSSPVRVVARLLPSMTGFLLRLLISLPVVGSVDLLSRLRSRSGAEGASQ